MFPKSLFFFLLCAISLTQPSCKKDEESQEVSYIYDFQIPAGTGYYYELKPDMDSRRNAWLSQLNLTRDQIKSVQVRFARFTIVNSADKFDFVDRAFLKIGKYDVAVPNPNYFEIAFNLQAPTTQNYIDLAPAETELKDYFLADKFRLSGKFIHRTNAITSVPLQVRLSLGFSVFKN